MPRRLAAWTHGRWCNAAPLRLSASTRRGGGAKPRPLRLLEHAHLPELLEALLRELLGAQLRQLVDGLDQVRVEQLRRFRRIGVRAARRLGDDVVDDPEALQVL